MDEEINLLDLVWWNGERFQVNYAVGPTGYHITCVELDNSFKRIVSKQSIKKLTQDELIQFVKECMIENDPESIPKDFVPKLDWVEIEKDNDEIVVLRENVKNWIGVGWRVTRLTKLSKTMLHAKHAKVIYKKELRICHT